jgi:predicted ATPase/class 3 adenylate cyclase
MNQHPERARELLPTGTVTFLFTDIEGSTTLATSFPEQMAALLERHHAILHASIQEQHGYVFQIVGDAFCAAFHTAAEALGAAVAAQRALQHEPWDPAPIAVRMGIHTGAAQVGDMDDRSGGYRGYLAMACTQRIMSSAHGGQVLLSGASAELARSQLPEGVALLELGKHRLKGGLDLEHLWQLVAEGLRAEFPPLQSPQAIPNNLPAQPSAFIGREAELGEIVNRLESEGVRLLTLTGPGGIGKTRLALQAASEVVGQFEDGVYFVDLAPIRDSEAAPAAMARTLGLRETSDRPPLDELKDQLREKRILLVLDNFEQVTAAAPQVADLLRDCAKLKVLVTSREALRVRGEYVYPIPTLALPKLTKKQLSIQQLTQYEAVRLFIERAQAVKPDFTVTNENAPAVAEICWRLDGLPLAIELAAARMRLFTPPALLERLESRLKFLRGGARDLPVRQQTLYAAIDWSYEMLGANEQRLFQALSVFQGCTFEAAETIAQEIESPRGQETEALDLIFSLMDKSLIRQVNLDNGEPRLLMLETIREFAVNRLEEQPGLSAAVRQAHAAYYADFTQRQWVRLTGAEREAAFTALLTDLENVRTAWDFWVDQRDLEKLGKFIDSLWQLYDGRGWYQSTIELTTDMLNVLATYPPTPERIQQELLLQTSLARALQVIKGYTQEVELAYTRALDLSREVGEIPELFPVLRGLGSLYSYLGEYEKAGQMAQKILNMAERLGDPKMLVDGHLRLGYILAFTGNISLGLEHLEKAIAGYDPDRFGAPPYQLGNNPGVIGLNVSALILWMVGFPDRAHERAHEAIALARRLSHPYSLAYALFHTGMLHLWRREEKSALECSQAVLDIASEHEFLVWSAVATCLHGAALAGMEQAEEGLALVRKGIESYQGLNTPPVFWPLLIHMLAETCGLAGQPEQGLATLDRAMKLFDSDSREAFVVEFYRLRGELLLASSPDHSPEAETLFLRALEIAQEQGAPMLELRAALSLNRMRQDQDKANRSRKLLRAAYEKISEGFTTADLEEAKALLEGH